MDKRYAYFCTQSKRALKVLPMQLLVNSAVCILVGGLAFFFVRDGALASGNLKYQVGVVGDMDNPYLGFGIQALQAVDDARFIVELTSLGEEEAREAFQKGELNAFVRIPDGLIESIQNGAGGCLITYVTAEGQKGIGSIVAGEIIDVVSEFVTDAQSGIYGMQKILADYGKVDRFWENTEQLNFRYLDVVFHRKKFYELEILGISNGLSTEGYYFCSILLFFLLLSGISNSLLFSGRSAELPRFLQAKGIAASGQILGEYLAYVGMAIICIVEIFLILAVIFASGLFSIPEWEGMGAPPLGVFLLRLFPVIFMIAAMQLLIYELVSNIVSSILLQFLCGISMGYLSGFFYPSYFFPETLRKIGEVLPTGAALAYVDSSMTGDFSCLALVGVLCYCVCFLELSVFARKSKIRRG